MRDDAGCWIQMQGLGGGGRFEDKLKKVWHRWSWQSVWLAYCHVKSTQVVGEECDTVDAG